MIRQIGPESRGEFLAALGDTPFFAAVMAASFEVNAGKNTGVRFFLADGAAVSVSGGRALVCGACDEDELASFFAFSGVQDVRTSGARPAGFEPDELFLMEYVSPREKPLPEGYALEEMPSMTQLGETLCYTDGTVSAGDFVSEACARRNRGLAHIWALRAPDGYAATAGVYALSGREAYLGGVITKEEYRGRGCAGALVLRLANEYHPRRAVRLICAPHRRSFYESLGFAARPGLLAWRAGQNP